MRPEANTACSCSSQAASREGSSRSGRGPSRRRCTLATGSSTPPQAGSASRYSSWASARGTWEPTSTSPGRGPAGPRRRRPASSGGARGWGDRAAKGPNTEAADCNSQGLGPGGPASVNCRIAVPKAVSWPGRSASTATTTPPPRAARRPCSRSRPGPPPCSWATAAASISSKSRRCTWSAATRPPVFSSTHWGR